MASGSDDDAIMARGNGWRQEFPPGGWMVYEEGEGEGEEGVK